MTDELLARRILALEERIERVESSGPSIQRVVLDAIADLRRDTADRFDRMDQRLDRLDQRFEGIDSRFNGIDQRLDRMDQRLDRMDQRLDRMDQRLNRMEEGLDGVDGRFDVIERMLGQVLALIGGPPGRS